MEARPWPPLRVFVSPFVYKYPFDSDFYLITFDETKNLICQIKSSIALHPICAVTNCYEMMEIKRKIP